MKKVFFYSFIAIICSSCSCCSDVVIQNKYYRYKQLYNSNERAEAVYLFEVIQKQKENGVVTDKGIEAFEYCIRMRGGVE